MTSDIAIHAAGGEILTTDTREGQVNIVVRPLDNEIEETDFAIASIADRK